MWILLNDRKIINATQLEGILIPSLYLNSSSMHISYISAYTYLYIQGIIQNSQNDSLTWSGDRGVVCC